MFNFSKKDEQLEDLKKTFEGKIIAEKFKTKINRHKVFWIGRSKHDDKLLRIGLEFSDGGRYFFDWESFKNSDRFKFFEILTPLEADKLEKEIQEKGKKKKL